MEPRESEVGAVFGRMFGWLADQTLYPVCRVPFVNSNVCEFGS